ncbi:thyroglobulin-like [Gigantopelta aegis]|uniref:thyroglobulin-like n=1 Tax=Gigantopelta aegis TaxID=1735272 RepID=UPI001B88DE23|nr:thyroglobulin-like [Gigantopelta aegis]
MPRSDYDSHQRQTPAKVTVTEKPASTKFSKYGDNAGFDEVKKFHCPRYCWCVKPNGDEIPGYHIVVFEVDENTLTCECARKAAAFQETGLIGLIFSCTNTGVFTPVQCTGSMCYCADSNGEQIGSAVGMWQRNSLNCS